MKKVALTVAVLTLGLAACQDNAADNEASTVNTIETEAAADVTWHVVGRPTQQQHEVAGVAPGELPLVRVGVPPPMGVHPFDAGALAAPGEHELDSVGGQRLCAAHGRAFSSPATASNAQAPPIPAMRVPIA